MAMCYHRGMEFCHSSASSYIGQHSRPARCENSPSKPGWGFLAITTINQDYLIRSLETYPLCWNGFTSTPEGPLFSNLTNSQKVVYPFCIISNLSSGPNVGLLQPWQCNSTFHVQVQVSLKTSVGIASMNGHTTAVTNLLLSSLGTPVKPLFPIPSKQTYFCQGWPTTHTFMSPLLKQSCSISFTQEGHQLLWNPTQGILFPRHVGQPNQTTPRDSTVFPFIAANLAVQTTQLQGHKFPNGWGGTVP